MKFISMTEAMKVIGTTTTMRGKDFAKKWGLTPVNASIQDGRRQIWLFDVEEVHARKRELDQQVIDNARREFAQTQSAPLTKTDLSVLRETVDDYQPVLYRIEEKLDRLLAAFDMPREVQP